MRFENLGTDILPGGRVGDSDYSVPMDVNPEGQGDPVNTPGFLDDVKSFAKTVVTAPGKIIAANLAPIEQGAASAVSDIGKGAGNAVSAITGPLIPVLLIALVGGYIYFNSKRVSVNVGR